jgi:hypothetical protein
MFLLEKILYVLVVNEYCRGFVDFVEYRKWGRYLGFVRKN